MTGCFSFSLITTFYGTLGLYGSGCMSIYHLTTLFLTARLIKLDYSGGTVSDSSISRGRTRKRRQYSTSIKAKVDRTWVESLRVYQPLVFPVQQQTCRNFHRVVLCLDPCGLQAVSVCSSPTQEV
jgi:hypothetical protein